MESNRIGIVMAKQEAPQQLQQQNTSKARDENRDDGWCSIRGLSLRSERERTNTESGVTSE